MQASELFFKRNISNGDFLLSVMIYMLLEDPYLTEKSTVLTRNLFLWLLLGYLSLFPISYFFVGILYHYGRWDLSLGFCQSL